MGSITCPKCNAVIPPDDLNIREGVALCRACNSLTRLADLAEDIAEPIPASTDAAKPPRGCSVSGDGVQTVLRASCRSVVAAGATLFFCLFWNGIVSVFVLIALASTIYHIFGSVPTWFPAPPMGKNQSPHMPLGVTIFMWIFLTPFITIGVVMLGAALTAMFGRVEVRIRTDRAVIFTGCGPIGWRRRFDPASVKRVSVGHTTWQENNRSKPVIVIEAGRTIRVGSALTPERRAWLAAALKELLEPGRK